ncbi:hypothetical protein [Williamsia soli]|uniref:hypothetical protein n=1 Tax=Williamsia soli TaxID=364929 RepID=UPI001A9E8943|nr:hypothetical protein [Williamsia soli]
MTHTATLTRENVPGKGVGSTISNCYQLSEPLDGVEFLTVTCIDMPKWNCQMTSILPAMDGDGAPLSAPDGTLAMSITKPLMDPAEALAELGYTVVTDPEEP